MTLALLEAVDGEAGDQDHADGIRRHRPDQPRRRVGTSDGAHGEAEVADDTVVPDEDECPGRVHVLAASPWRRIQPSRVSWPEVKVVMSCWGPRRSSRRPGRINPRGA